MKYLRLFAFAFLLTSISSISRGQSSVTCIHPEIGCALSHDFFAELGIMHSTTGSKEGDPLGLFGYKIAGECNFIRNNFIIAPKVAAEIDLLFLGVRLNMIDYTSSGMSDFRFRPEGGLTLLGFITLFAGYNIPLGKTTLNGVNTFVLSLNINFNKSYRDNLHFF